MDKADKAEKADYINLTDIFLMIEADKLIPEIQADIPGIGVLTNLYSYVFDCFSFCLKNKHSADQQETYKFYLNQLHIIIYYLIDNGLIKSDKLPVVPVTPIRQIKPEILEQQVRYKNAELGGSLEGHPELEQISSLWKNVIEYEHTPQLSSFINQLKQINLYQLKSLSTIN